MAQAVTTPAAASGSPATAQPISQEPSSSSTEAATIDASIAAQAKTKGCPANVLAAIYGKKPANKAQAYDYSLKRYFPPIKKIDLVSVFGGCAIGTAKRWWVEYADRKNDEEDEHVADSLLYDKRHLPRTAPAPDGVLAAIAADKAAAKLKCAASKAQASS